MKKPGNCVRKLGSEKFTLLKKIFPSDNNIAQGQIVVCLSWIITVIIYWETTECEALSYLLYAFTFNVRPSIPYKVPVMQDE